MALKHRSNPKYFDRPFDSSRARCRAAAVALLIMVTNYHQRQPPYYGRSAGVKSGPLCYMFLLLCATCLVDVLVLQATRRQQRW